MSPRWTLYVVPKHPSEGVLKIVSKMCPKFEKLAAVTPKRYEIGCQLLLITNRKSYTRFRLVPTSMTLNDVERSNIPYFAFFSTEFDSFADWLCHSGCCLPVAFFQFWPKLMHPAARSLCDSWALLHKSIKTDNVYRRQWHSARQSRLRNLALTGSYGCPNVKYNLIRLRMLYTKTTSIFFDSEVLLHCQ